MTAPNDNESYDPSADPEQDDVEDDSVLDASDTLEGDPGDDPLDAGIITADRWSAGEGFGTTQAEEREGESLDQLLAEEEPEPDPYAEAADAEDDPLDDGPDPRAGGLLSADEGAHSDQEPDLVANDVGIDGGAATAEEAAVHVLADDEDG